MPVLADEQRRRQHRDQHLHDEDDRRDLRGGAPLQRAHLGQEPEAGGDPCRGGPHQQRHDVAVVQGVGDELGREPAPRQRGTGPERHQHAAAAQREGQERQHADAAEDRGERRVAGMVRRGVRGDERQQRDAGQDAEHRERLADAHALVQMARADEQQQHEPEGERRLDDRQRREQQRGRLQRPAQQVQRRARQPAATADEAQQQRRTQRVVSGRLPRVERLKGEAEVVQRRRRARRTRSEDD
ncbi:MAG: hypothetical protein QOF26_275 [Baekduia sp.]|nr:hypothetical protein [Baekduia sp.]